jgi:hypothetical protein
MAEAMRLGKPVIATAYSGNMDFMNERNSFLCRFEMSPVGPGSPPYPARAFWAEPNISHAAELMRKVYDHPEEAGKRGRFAAEDLAMRFNPQRCADAVKIRWQEIRSSDAQAERNRPLPAANPGTFSSHVKTLHKQWKRPFNVAKTVPSLGTILFQGPRKILQKMLLRIMQHRMPFDEAVVIVTSSHDQRLANLERSVVELREQNAMLLVAQKPFNRKIQE